MISTAEFKLYKKRSGFTLIELLVVISIIAILSIIGLALYGNVQKGARDAKRKEDIKAISKALEMYKTDKGKYPEPTEAWSSHTGGGSGTDWTDLGTNLAEYIHSMPADPMNKDDGACGSDTGCHLYHYCSSDGTWYIIAVNLEGESSQDAPPSTCPTGGTNFYWIPNQQ